MVVLSMTAEFRVTFGQRYRREEHPAFPKAHPDGWLTVVADDENKARAWAFEFLGDRWAFLQAEPFDRDDWDGHYPLGELHRVEAPA